MSPGDTTARAEPSATKTISTGPETQRDPSIAAPDPVDAGPGLARPVRIQRRRVKGWRMPKGAIYVGRGSAWGNPIRTNGLDRRQVIARYEEHLARNPELVTAARARLRGRSLACWCPLVDDDGARVPCHAEVLLRIANEPDASAPLTTIGPDAT